MAAEPLHITSTSAARAAAGSIRRRWGPLLRLACLMLAQCSCLMNSAHPLPPSFFSRLSLLRPQLHAHEKRSIGASENCDKEERTPEGHLDAPSGTATSAAPDGFSVSAALDMATCDHGVGGDGSWPSSSSSSSSPTGNGKEPAVPLPVVESMNGGERGSEERREREERTCTPPRDQ